MVPQPWIGFVFMSEACVATKGHMETQGLGHNVWLCRSMLPQEAIEKYV